VYTIASLAKLQKWFARLPGIGPKSAMRMAFHVLELDDEDVRQFATDMYSARLSVRRCEICGVLTDDERCSLCEDETRDRSVICVVADTRSVMAFEKTGEYRGVYHVLGGLISPLDGIGPDEIGIDKLAARVREGGVREVIIATGSNVQGEATAMYIAQELEDMPVTVSRIAHGMPVGGEVENTDPRTLLLSLEGRTKLGG
jgi:recombination protein RecR